MPNTIAAAIDLGATSGRVILGTWNGRSLRLDEVHRFENRFHVLNGYCYWEVGKLFDEIVTGLRKAKLKAPKLQSCGIDTWGCDYALLDKQGRLAFPVHAYRDTRTVPYSRRLAKSGIEEVYAKTGITNLSYNSSFQLQETLDCFPDLPKSVARCLFLPDYFNYLLSGRMENEISIVSTTQLLNVNTTGFSRDALRIFGIPPSWFSQPILSPAKLGRVRGIPELNGVSVIAVPGHDTSCAYDAMPATPDGGDIFLSSGTFSLLGFESDKPVLALKEAVSNERLGDGRYRPIRSCLGLWLLERILPEFKSRPSNDAEWEQLIRAAETAPVPEKLINVTDRSLFNPKSMKEAIDKQLKRKKARPPRDLAGYTRLICDSLGEGHGRAVADFERLTGQTFHRILVVGGGSKNRLLCQATASASGIPVVSFALEGTAVGNLANQFVALGAVKSLSEFRAHLAKTLKQTVYTPA